MVVNELINNSIKHNEGQPDLEIEIQVSKASEEKLVRIRYRDNGRGFLDAAGRDSKNTGIGMMVIESVILDEMSGRIKRYNEDGAVVEIELPMQSLLQIEIR